LEKLHRSLFSVGVGRYAVIWQVVVRCLIWQSRHLSFLGGVPMGEFMIEIWSFMRERKKFWLLPIILCLVMLGSLIVFTSGSAVAPFIYTLF
jgi:hypothetical protein